MYCEICTKANGLSRGCRAEIFKILHSVDILVCKNTKWPTCVYMIKKYNTNSGDIFFIKLRGPKTEELL